VTEEQDGVQRQGVEETICLDGEGREKGVQLEVSIFMSLDIY